MRPSVGDTLRTCPACGGYEYSGAPGCPRCTQLVDDIVEERWRDWLGREFGTLSPDDERSVAGMVVGEPDRHDWRVVDAAYDRLTCPECGGRLSRGPAGCGPCDFANGFRYVAIEVDRPGVPPGNEHAIRVNVSVVRRPHALSARELLVRRVLLPALLVGYLPTTEEAQRASALLRDNPTYETAVRLLDALVSRG
ncbi:hypothetical protein [Microbispora oryzae]|uniref:hypothetical protein n=1 Tax=Microbispora oryzae TaxID=2806554 RepID=UPI001E455B9E|nr:hypothetical protein [Microbispora oryzae]